MSVPKFKRKPSGLDYVDNAYNLQTEIMNLCSKLSARWARIYQQPIDKLACLQADLVNMAYSINPVNYEDYNVTTSSNSLAIKNNSSGSASKWGLRSAASDDSSYFYNVNSGGQWSYSNANSSNGVAPAFRLAN